MKYFVICKNDNGKDELMKEFDSLAAAATYSDSIDCSRDPEILMPVVGEKSSLSDIAQYVRDIRFQVLFSGNDAIDHLPPMSQAFFNLALSSLEAASAHFSLANYNSMQGRKSS